MTPKITLDMLRDAGTADFPVIDLGAYMAGAPGALERVAGEFHRALTEIGFLLVVDHGIPQAKLDGIQEAARGVHDLPMPRKLEMAMGQGSTGYLASGGYVIKTSQVNDNRKPDLNEAFFIDRERRADDPEVVAKKPFRELNKWPDEAELPGFRAFALDYWATLEAFAQKLLPPAAVALGLEPGFFDRAFDGAQCVLRLSHFPPVAYDDNQFGIAPHTDANFFTVLPQSNVEGLYIRPAGRDWIRAPRIPGAIVINAGDMCRRWTNDRFLSTEHLAINPTQAHRYSTPFFFTPHIDWPITCLPTCTGPGNPPKYTDITYGEYRTWWLRKNYHSKIEATGPAA